MSGVSLKENWPREDFTMSVAQLVEHSICRSNLFCRWPKHIKELPFSKVSTPSLKDSLFTTTNYIF
jgi:hypothetical protein